MSKKKILFLSPYPVNKAPSQRLKYEQYFKAMEAHGFEVETSSFVSLKFWNIIYKKGFVVKKVIYTISGYIRRTSDLFKLKKYDIVYIHLWVTPFGFPIYEKLVRFLSKKIIYDIDDMIFLGHSSEANRLLENLKGKNKMITLMKDANHIITCTPTLDNFVRQYNLNTTDISSTIDTEKYKPKVHKTSEKTVLGWSGSHSTSKYVKLLEPIFLELIEKNYNFEVMVIGDENFKFNSDSIPLKSISWNLETEVLDLKKIDIGLYPLPNEKWVLGKSGLKALQYMSLGIPTVATKIGANTRIIKHQINGYLVNENAQWINCIEKLIKNAELRNKIGLNAVETVEKNFSIKSSTKTYLDVLRGVL